MTHSLSTLATPILALPRTAKRLFALCVDLGLCVLTVWLAYYLRLGEFVALAGSALWAVVAAIGLAIPIFIVSGLYRAIFRYSGWPALLAVARAVGIYSLLYASVFTAIGVAGCPARWASSSRFCCCCSWAHRVRWLGSGWVTSI